MSDINPARLPMNILAGLAYLPPPYIADDVNHTLTRGERWARYLSNGLPIVLIRSVLASVKYLDRY